MKKWLWWICLTVVAIILSFLEWRYPVPTGSLDVQVMGIIIIAIALGLDVALSYASLVLVTLIMLVVNLQNGLTVLPVLLVLVVISLLLHGNTSLKTHLTHSQAISFGLISGGVQLIGTLVVVAIQSLMMTNKWDVFTAMLRIALPVALLNGLLVCLFVPPLTLGIRHYTEKVTNDQNREG